MNLSFDSIADLQDFLHWADKYRAVDLTVNRARDPIGPIVAQAAAPDTPFPKIDPSGIAFDTPPAEAAKEPAGKVPEQPAEPAKRKRRTKAEIEADEKAVAAAAEAKAAGGHVDADKAAEPVVQFEGINPFEQTATPAAGAASPAAEPAGAGDGEDTVVTPFQHITRGREFIAKHGMPKYNETFTKAGLDANVMAYTGYQRALHMAAMDELEKAG